MLRPFQCSTVLIAAVLLSQGLEAHGQQGPVVVHVPDEPVELLLGSLEGDLLEQVRDGANFPLSLDDADDERWTRFKALDFTGVQLQNISFSSFEPRALGNASFEVAASFRAALNIDYERLDDGRRRRRRWPGRGRRRPRPPHRRRRWWRRPRGKSHSTGKAKKHHFSRKMGAVISKRTPRAQRADAADARLLVEDASAASGPRGGGRWPKKLSPRGVARMSLGKIDVISTVTLSTEAGKVVVDVDSARSIGGPLMGQFPCRTPDGPHCLSLGSLPKNFQQAVDAFLDEVVGDAIEDAVDALLYQVFLGTFGSVSSPKRLASHPLAPPEILYVANATAVATSTGSSSGTVINLAGAHVTDGEQDLFDGGRIVLPEVQSPSSVSVVVDSFVLNSLLFQLDRKGALSLATSRADLPPGFPVDYLTQSWIAIPSLRSTFGSGVELRSLMTNLQIPQLLLQPEPADSLFAGRVLVVLEARRADEWTLAFALNCQFFTGVDLVGGVDPRTGRPRVTVPSVAPVFDLCSLTETAIGPFNPRVIGSITQAFFDELLLPRWLQVLDDGVHVPSPLGGLFQQPTPGDWSLQVQQQHLIFQAELQPAPLPAAHVLECPTTSDAAVDVDCSADPTKLDCTRLQCPVATCGDIPIRMDCRRELDADVDVDDASRARVCALASPSCRALQCPSGQWACPDGSCEAAPEECPRSPDATTPAPTTVAPTVVPTRPPVRPRPPKSCSRLPEHHHPAHRPGDGATCTLDCDKRFQCHSSAFSCDGHDNCEFRCGGPQSCHSARFECDTRFRGTCHVECGASHERSGQACHGARVRCGGSLCVVESRDAGQQMHSASVECRGVPTHVKCTGKQDCFGLTCPNCASAPLRVDCGPGQACAFAHPSCRISRCKNGMWSCPNGRCVSRHEQC